MLAEIPKAQQPMLSSVHIPGAGVACLMPTQGPGSLLVEPIRWPSVVSLLFCGGPSDIANFVVSVWINAVQRHARRAFPDCVQQFGNVRETKFNASPAIVRIVGMPRVLAPAFCLTI